MEDTMDKTLTCDPLKTLEEVWQWSPKSCSRWPVQPLASRSPLSCLGEGQCCHRASADWRPHKRFDHTSVPKTLVCHDMKGGYLDDRFVYGTDKQTDYRFFHWCAIDTFVYFSHHFVTIPPPVWVNAAHRHGVLILGTVIMEWDSGRKITEQLLRGGEECIQRFCDQLADISLCYGLDGWLLNVEHKLDKNDVPLLHHLLAKLTSTMHRALPHSQVIWYDSVTKDGDLKWQNELNHLNRKFFDECDGIFLNYAWKDENLARSVQEAGVRALDVYVGVDVHGRGCFGGGGFNTKEAVMKARTFDLSIALFAPGWVHEFWSVENFTPLEYKFWRLLWPLLYVHGPRTLPFESSFCQGYGLRNYHNGKVVSELPWHNLSEQQLQPCLPACVADEDSPPTTGGPTGELHGEQVRGCVQHWPKDAFRGGGCLLLLRPVSLETMDSIIHKLLLCSFEVKSGESLLVSCAVKSPVTELVDVEPELGIWLVLQDLVRGSHRCEYLGEGKCNVREVMAADRASHLQQKYPELQEQLQVNTKNGWFIKHFEIPALADSEAYRVVEVCVTLSPRTARVLLGWLAIRAFAQ